MKMICKFLIVILFFSIATVYADTIRDPRLERAIKKVLYNFNPSWPIPVEDLEKLTKLNVHWKGIVDLTGLEYCTNLKKLELSFNEITDISPLSELVNLEELNLYGNKITDISPLSQLVNLKDLNLGINEITDISPLVRNSGLSQGDVVGLTGNQLSSKSLRDYIPQLKERGVNVYRWW